MMHIRLSVFLVFILISINRISNTKSTFYTDSSQCSAKYKNCTFCPQNKEPGCVTPIYLDEQCVKIRQSSLQLYDTCSSNSLRITNKLCQQCNKNMGSNCVQAACLNGQFARITQCSMHLN